MRPFHALFCALTLAGAVAAGCGDDTESSSTTASTTTSSGTPTGSGGGGATGGVGTGATGGTATGGDGGMGTGGTATGGMGGMGMGGMGGMGVGGGAGGSAPGAVESVDCNGIVLAATITATNFQFAPTPATISVGGVVQYVNGGGVHSMVSVPAGQFQSGPAGQDGCLKFNVAGTYPYQCGVHGAAMPGTVIVQ